MRRAVGHGTFEACSDELSARAGALASALYAELFDDVAAQLCPGAAPDEGDAGVSEPGDAGVTVTAP